MKRLQRERYYRRKRLTNPQKAARLLARASLLQRLAEVHGWICWYCGRKVDLHGQRAGCADHVIPVSQGGANDFSNLALACCFCNRAKYDWPAEELIAWLDFMRFDRRSVTRSIFGVIERESND